jgi:hypothetical protein
MAWSVTIEKILDEGPLSCQNPDIGVICLGSNTRCVISKRECERLFACFGRTSGKLWNWIGLLAIQRLEL